MPNYPTYISSPTYCHIHSASILKKLQKLELGIAECNRKNYSPLLHHLLPYHLPDNVQLNQVLDFLYHTPGTTELITKLPSIILEIFGSNKLYLSLYQDY